MIALVVFLFSIESRTIFLLLRVVKENSLCRWNINDNYSFVLTCVLIVEFLSIPLVVLVPDASVRLTRGDNSHAPDYARM
jgi:hypothetical protein